MAKPAEATLGHISLNRFAVCDCSDFHVCDFIPLNIILIHNSSACVKRKLYIFHFRK